MFESLSRIGMKNRGTNHKTCDILEKNQRDVALGTKLNEMRPFQCRFGEEDAIVTHNPDWLPHYFCEPSNKSLPPMHTTSINSRFSDCQSRTMLVSHNDAFEYVIRIDKKRELKYVIEGKLPSFSHPHNNLGRVLTEP